jgi:hypothetical protein
MFAYKDTSADIGCLFEYFLQVVVLDLFDYNVQVVNELGA